MSLTWLLTMIGGVLVLRVGTGVLAIHVDLDAPDSGIGVMAIGTTFEIG